MNVGTVHERGVCCSIVTMLVASAALALGGCTLGGGPNQIEKKPKVGLLAVGLYYGVGAVGSAMCGGSGTVTIRSEATGQQISKGYGFSGLWNTTSPACQTGVTFEKLEPGLWTISSGNNSGICQKQVNPGLGNNIDIGIDGGVFRCT